MGQLSDGFTDREFRRLGEVVEYECGLVFPASKRIMLETRLRRRARALGLESLSSYCEHLENPVDRSKELAHLIDAVTTHKTDFFREPAHFDYLAKQALPDLVAREQAGLRRPLAVWSSACSTGEEPYTLAMVLSDYASSNAANSFRFRIEATDISSVVLEKGRMGVYPEAVAAPVPPAHRKRYLLRGRNAQRDSIRVAPELRAAVRFRQLNLMDAGYEFPEPFDIVFCRNVMIYFERATQQAILGRIVRTLRPGGYLFMGHAESLSGLDLPLIQVEPAIYRRPHG
jgi:chemotaxis protein methyltransferase CheR